MTHIYNMMLPHDIFSQAPHRGTSTHLGSVESESQVTDALLS